MNIATAFSSLSLLEIETGLLIILVIFSIFLSLKLARSQKEITKLKKGYDDQVEVQHLRDDSLAMLVHELRSPLSVMRGASDLIIKDAQRLSKEQIETLLAQIRTSSNGMLKIVDDILDVSKIESGKFEIHKTFGDLNKVLGDECNYYDALAEGKQISIVCELDQNIPSFNFDADRVQQVMNNLLSNAIKFSNDGGKVTVKTTKNQSNIEVAVCDEGEGIPDEFKAKLFHKFVQISNGHSTMHSTGLGLVITKGIVEAHGGTVWIEDNKPKGSKFIFSLPLS